MSVVRSAVRVCIPAVLLLAGSRAQAQVVRGQVTDAQSGAAIVGAFVRLVDTAGVAQRTAETLTTASGSYQLKAPVAGRWRIRIERLGYATYQSDPFTLDSVITKDMRLPQYAIELPAITASADAHCGTPGADAVAAATIWEEIRKALTVASWTSQSGSVTFHIVSRNERLDPRDMSVHGAAVDTTSGTLKASPFASFPEDSLLQKGFVHTDEHGVVTYYGPDAELIMSDGFQNTHCFHAVVNAKDSGMVGVAFEPSGKVKPVDVRGTLWIDKNSFELKRLEFGYDHLPAGVPKTVANGTLNFAHLSTGLWIISEWSITAPVMMPGGVTSNGARMPDVMAGARRVSQRVLAAYVNGRKVF